MDLAATRPPACELFLVLEPFRQGFHRFVRALEPLSQAADEGPLLQSSDVYYRPDTDVALLAIRFDERSTSPQKLGWLDSIAARADLPVLDPSRLGHSDREAFYRDYLPTYRIRVEANESPCDGLEELARLLAIPGAPARVPPPPAGRLPVGSSASRTPAPGAPPAGRPARGTQPRGSYSESRRERITVGAGAERYASPTAERPAGKRRAAERAATLPASPRAFAPEPGPANVAVKVAAPISTSAPPPELDVRFLRGDAWSPARLRSLSLRGARLAAAAPPRRGDRVPIVLGLDRVGAVVTGHVTEVVTAADAHGSGEPVGFAAQFVDLAPAARDQLASVLRTAVDRGLSLRPPPARAAVRFPVFWPTRLITEGGELRAAMLDVSRSGLFVAPSAPLGETEVEFQIPLDQTAATVCGRAVIAREVSDEMANKRGLPRGYGMRILDFSRESGERYDGFLDRVRRRTEMRLIVAAESARAQELSRRLTGAGYSVHATGDLAALIERLASGARPPDAALIHAPLCERDPRSEALKRALNERQVPSITIGEEPAHRARQVVDHLLGIG